MLQNFRDVADLGGPPLTPGVLFRSAAPFDLTGPTIADLRERRIGTVLDLREPREQIPPDWEPVAEHGITVVRVPLAGQVMANPAARAQVSSGRMDGDEVLGRFYVAIADHAGEGLAAVLGAVAAGRPALVHCAAGKDRTGTVVALLLGLIGADEESIVADYLLTNEAMPQVLRAQRLALQHAASDGNPDPEVDPDAGLVESAPAALQLAPESAIRALLDHVRAAGGARAVLSRHAESTLLDQVEAALTHG